VHFQGEIALGQIGVDGRKGIKYVDASRLDYAIFDDVKGGLEYWHQYKDWLGHQRHFGTTDKYTGKCQVTWGKPAIYITNDHQYHLDRANDKRDWDYLEDNCVIVKIDRGPLAWVVTPDNTPTSTPQASQQSEQLFVPDNEHPTRFHT